MEDVEYRYELLNASHVDRMLALQERCWTFDGGIYILSSRALIERMFQFRNFAFGAFAGEELIGFITCSLPSRRAQMNLGRHFGFSDEMLDQVAHANIMVIAPEHRRRGAGRVLFAMMMQAIPESFEWIMTTTKLENALARRLLEHRGFEHAKTIEIAGEPRAIYVFHRTSGR